ncbi:MAG: alkaline phosphatase family protein [Chitinophagales bacterium]
MIKKIALFIAGVSMLHILHAQNAKPEAAKPTKKLYWFIPDGMRAEPDLFNIYKWANEGKLPNIKKMMERGSYGYSKPAFPTHTPVNYATLLTGTWPKTNGVGDGPMHEEGFELNKVSVGGFSSTARKIPAVWSTLEDAGDKVLIMAVPGSTPPEIQQGIVVRGRWGGWGADFQAINFESNLDGSQRVKQGKSNKLFFAGPELTQYKDAVAATGWQGAAKSFSPPLEVKLTAWGDSVYAYLYDNTDDKKTNYNRVSFSADKKKILADLSQGAWSIWHNVTLKWKDRDVPSQYKFHVIKLGADGFFRLRVYYNCVNQFNTQPADVAAQLTKNVGPMTDFVDNFPPQLLYYPEDKTTFTSEMNQSFAWHTKAIGNVESEYKPDAVIHSIYNPNQMLTSRWWMGYVDPKSKRYNDVKAPERKQLWTEVQDMYKKLDNMVGEILKSTDENTIVVLSSDHGICPIDKMVRINNVLAKAGYLKYTMDKKTGIPNIDWKNSTAIHLQMTGIYINPDGLADKWKRGSGPVYEKMRTDIAKLLNDLTDEDGRKPVSSVTKWEDVKEFLDLPADRSGDLIVSNNPGFGWSEDVSEDFKVFSVPLVAGYKQAIDVDKTNSVWTPFIIMGPGVKKNNKLPEPIQHVDQLPTILTLMGVDVPKIVEGKVLDVIQK